MHYTCKQAKPHVLKDKGVTTTQCDKLYTDPTVNAVCYKSPARHDEQVDRQKELKLLDEALRSEWPKERKIPDEHSKYCNKFVNLLAH